MAGLTKEDRINISLKIIEIPDEIDAIDQSVSSINDSKAQLESQDNSNKILLEQRTTLINFYQNELQLLDGITRTELTEPILLDSAKRVLNNSFFPNDNNTPLPSLPDGIWRSVIPFSKTHAVGKNEFEAYLGTGGRVEADIIADINSKIASIESENISRRASGQECIPGGFCTGETPPGSGTNETICTTNGGIWTSEPDTYAAYAVIYTLLNELKTLIQEWEDRLNDEKNQIPTDTNSTRKTGNDSAIADIDNAISIIDAWQAIQDFDTTTSLPTGNDGAACAIFDTLTEGYFQQAKLQPTTLQTLKDELVARSAFSSARTSQLTSNDYLGYITQDLVSGSISDTQGLYGERMLFIDMRLNLLSGTLSNIVGLENTANIQEQSKESSENAQKGLSLAMAVTRITAPGINTKYLNLQDLSQFSVGDRVYVMADEQEELSGSIEEIDGNRAKLTFVVPKKYTPENNTRLYKVL